MSKQTEVVILVDNKAEVPEVETEHGLAMWITLGEKHFLFDTGMGIALPQNTATLGVDLSRTDAVVLSHGHFDHTGGLPHVFAQGASPTIYMHPDAVRMRYGCLETPPHRPIGMRPEIAEALSAGRRPIVHTTEPTQIAEHIWVTGSIPRRTAYEDTGGPFFVDEQCHVKDLITDDQALWIETAEGIVVLLGCAHAGVVNTLDYIAEITGKTQFPALIGGMHLLNASAERLGATMDALEQYQIQMIAPCHCTGETPLSLLTARFPQQYIQTGAGTRFAWELKPESSA